jgi:rhodanese-related sulfurtransferase
LRVPRPIDRSCCEKISSLVYPGHDDEGPTSSTIGEERAHHPRIAGGAREEDFVGHLSNLGLPHPKQLAIDVRSAAEFDGELGHIAGAQLIPLDELRGRIAEVPSDEPVVVLCQTGKRSGMASVILSKAGHLRVANVAGGVLRWRELGLPG